MLESGLFEVSAPGLVYICLGGFVAMFSACSLLIKEKFFISEVVIGTAFGILIGPYGVGVLDPQQWGGTNNGAITLEVTRIVLVTGLFAIGIELPRAYMREHIKGLLILVVPTMAFGWTVVAGVMTMLFPDLTFVSCLAIAACLTPTDPVICAAIVGGKYAMEHVPENLRHVLSAEAATNDGLAYPFLSLAIYLTVLHDYDGPVFYLISPDEVVLGTAMGAAIGFLFSRTMKLSHARGFVDRESYIAQYLALSILVAGLVSTMGCDDLLAAFAAGCAISWDGHFNVQVEGAVFASVIDVVLNCACFVYIGAWIPFRSFDSEAVGITPWRLVVLLIAILFLRRIPPVMILYKWVPEIHSWREALFCGHFGPMGVSAVFVSTLALTRLPEPHHPLQDQAQLLAAVLQPIVAFVVLGSIVIHGLSISFYALGSSVSLPIHPTNLAAVTRTNSLWSGWRRAPAAYSTLEAGIASVVDHGNLAPVAPVAPPLLVEGPSSSRLEVEQHFNSSED